MKNSVTTTLAQAAKLVKRCFRADLVCMLHGSPAIGKSDIIRQIANEYNLAVIDIRLAQCDPTDLNGFPSVTNGVASYSPMDLWPLDKDPRYNGKPTPLPAGKHGWIIFFDEITSAPPAVQAAAYRIILDRQVGQYDLHKSVAICAAGNLVSDNAVVEEMSTALQSRMVHCEVTPHLPTWLDWANKNGIDTRIRAFLNFKENLFYRFDPDHDDKTYPAPRTWHMLSKLIKDESVSSEDLVLVAGTIGQGAAMDFISFCEVYGKLPTFEEILSNPDGFKLDRSDIAVKWAISTMISDKMESANIKACLTALDYIGVEFAHVAVASAAGRLGPAIAANPIAVKWIVEYSKKYHMNY